MTGVDFTFQFSDFIVVVSLTICPVLFQDCGLDQFLTHWNQYFDISSVERVRLMSDWKFKVEPLLKCIFGTIGLLRINFLKMFQ